MTDRVYPSAKPATATATNGAATTHPTFPATKAQLYGANRPAYRPQPLHRRTRRRCFCTFCFWLILLILILLLIIGVAGVAFYLLYRPHRPSFTVTSLKLSYLNLTSSSSTLSSKFDLTVAATNPNKRNIAFSYQPTSITILSGDVNIGDGTIPAFQHRKKNTTLLKASILSSGQVLDADAAKKLKASMKSKNGLPLTVKLDTKVKATMGKLKTPRVGIRVSCDGIRVTLPTGKKPATASTSNAKCNVDVRFKIWKWTIG